MTLHDLSDRDRAEHQRATNHYNVTVRRPREYTVLTTSFGTANAFCAKSDYSPCLSGAYKQGSTRTANWERVYAALSITYDLFRRLSDGLARVLARSLADEEPAVSFALL